LYLLALLVRFFAALRFHHSKCYVCHAGAAAGLAVPRPAWGALPCNVHILECFFSVENLFFIYRVLPSLLTSSRRYASALWAVQAAAAAQSGVLAASYRAALLNQ
jgi:hypothetical protein